MARKIGHSVLRPCAIEVTGGFLPGESTAPKNSDSRNSLKWHIAVSASGGPQVLDRYSRELGGIANTCSAQSLATLEGSDEQLYWQRICEFESRVLAESGEAAIVRASVPPTELPVFVKRAEELAGQKGIRAQFLVRALGTVYIAMLPGEDAGASVASTPATARTILQAASAVSGYATIQWCPRHWKNSVNVWGDERKDVALMRKLKNVFDPQRILAPGRFVSGI
jgi:FAD/FMN-containing dehydrogenase